jgi:hypothetical protein
MILTPDVDGSAPRASRRVSATTGLAAKGPSRDHIEEDGETVFRHACKLGSKASCPNEKVRLIVRAVRCDWLKTKNPPAML